MQDDYGDVRCAVRVPENLNKAEYTLFLMHCNYELEL